MKPAILARDAIAIVAQRRTVKARPADPQKHYDQTLNDLRGRIWGDVLIVAEDQPDLTPEELADIADPGTASAPTDPPAPQPEAFTPEPWTPLPDDAVARAKERIAQIKRDVLGVEQ